MDALEYTRIVSNMKDKLGQGELLHSDEGAGFDGGKQGYVNGVIALTNFRLLFQPEFGDVFEVTLHEISNFKRSKLLSFEYLEVISKNGSYRFQMNKGTVQNFQEVALRLLNEIESQDSRQDSITAPGTGARNLDTINDSAANQLNNFVTHVVEPYESEAGPVFFSFVQDSSNGQAAGRLNKLELLISRGWEFVGMTVLASDVAPGMRETHIIVSWKKDSAN